MRFFEKTFTYFHGVRCPFHRYYGNEKGTKGYKTGALADDEPGIMEVWFVISEGLARLCVDDFLA